MCDQDDQSESHISGDRALNIYLHISGLVLDKKEKKDTHIQTKLTSEYTW